jgi:DNA invertase Pin-like site-specific DNA recombinase
MNSTAQATAATAVAYYRTSSQTNVGQDKDSLKRQQDAVQAYAKAQGIEIVREFYDAAVSGGDPVEGRPGFADMLGYMLGNGARIVLVENASRFARDLTVQLLGHALLKKHGIELIPVDAPAYFTDETPTARMVRSILGAVSQFEKEALVLKLRKARERSKRLGGNPNWLQVPAATVQAAIAAKAKGLSLRAISSELAKLGYLSPSGSPYGPESIRRMVTR